LGNHDERFQKAIQDVLNFQVLLEKGARLAMALQMESSPLISSIASTTAIMWQLKMKAKEESA
jgi:hypothetical protein